jgi:hypothetical protein
VGDALDDRQAEPDACVVRAYSFGAAVKWLDKGGDQLWREHLAGVLDREHGGLRANAGRNPHGALIRQIVNDRVMHEVRRHLQQERMRADGGGHVASGLDAEASPFCEREKRLCGFFRDEGQVHVFPREGPLISAAEQEQCLSEVDRAGVDDVEAIDQFSDVAIWIAAGHVEQCPRYSQRGAQFVGGIGCESPLFADMSFDPFEHGVEGVGKVAELISPTR